MGNPYRPLLNPPQVTDTYNVVQYSLYFWGNSDKDSKADIMMTRYFVAGNLLGKLIVNDATNSDKILLKFN